MKNYNDVIKKKQALEGLNHGSREKVEDLLKISVPNTDKNKNVVHKEYQREMYSEEQLFEQSKIKENIYTVNGVPSRWEHNKKYSNFHFNPFIDPNTDIPFIIPVRFTNDFSKVVQKATNEHVEMTLGNYRKRNESKQDKDLHDGELLDIKRASGQKDLPAMGKVPIYRKTDDKERINSEPEYEVLHRIRKYLDMEVQQARLHIQRLGMVTPIHIDQQMRNARPDRRKQWLSHGGDKNPLVLRRWLIHLQDWDYGHVWQFGNTYHQGYKSGSAVTYDWCNVPHGTANFGFNPRVTFQITGFVSKFTQELIDNALNGGETLEIEV
jgi:hypothetical protein